MKTNKIVLIALLMGGFALLSSAAFSQTEWNIPDKYKSMENPYTNAEDDDDIGEDLYERHCASCHGDEGYGDGKKAARLKTPMRDLTLEEVQSQSDGVLYYKSIVGKDEMPNFEKKIRYKKDRWLLVNYIKRLDE